MFGSGGIISRAVSEPAWTHTITEGTAVYVGRTENLFGFDDGTYSTGGQMGSISPTTYAGLTIQSCWFSDGDLWFEPNSNRHEFMFRLPGNRPQNFFTAIFVEGFGQLLSADAARTYATFPDFTRWFWDVGTKAALWDGSGTARIAIS